jgi:hypothetical protein
MTQIVKQKTKAIILSKVTDYMLGTFILAAALCYVYFASSAVRDLTMLQKTKQQIGHLSIKVSELESKKLSFENKINIETAKQLGLVEINNPSFIIRNSSQNALSFKTN